MKIMKLVIKEKLGYTRALLLLSLFAVAFAAIGAFVGEIFIAVSAALLSCVFLFENKGRRIFSFAVPVLIIAVCALVGGVFSVFGVETLALALVICFFVSRGYRKSVCAAIITSLVVVFSFISLVIVAIEATGQMSVDAVRDFYVSLYETAREEFVGQIMSAFSEIEKMYLSSAAGAAPNLPSAEDVGAVFDSFVDSLISLFVIFGFFISGIALKVFTAVSASVAERSNTVLEWRFRTGSLFAYFYVVLYFVSLFITVGDSAAALTVVNLYSIFMFVYAYVGFRTVFALLRVRCSQLVSWIIMIAALLLLSSFAVQILSILGVMATITTNRFEADNGTTPSGDGL